MTLDEFVTAAAQVDETRPDPTDPAPGMPGCQLDEEVREARRLLKGLGPCLAALEARLAEVESHLPLGP